MRKPFAALAAVAVTAALAACSATAGSTTTSPPRPVVRLSHVIGMTGPGMPGTFKSVPVFEKATGAHVGLVLYYSGWYEAFKAAFAQEAYDSRAVVIVDVDSSGVPLSGIADGKYDAYMTRLGREIAAFGHPVIISFDHEMNGTWFDYGYKHAAPAEYVAAYRRFHNVVDAQTSLVTWMWTFNVPAGNRTEPLGPLYPGSSYVDMVGVDGYDWSGTLAFPRLFGAALADARAAAPGKPIVISETAVAPGPRAGWQVTSLFDGVESDHLDGFVWFDDSKVNDVGSQDRHDWRLENDPAALAAFRAAVKDSK